MKWMNRGGKEWWQMNNGTTPGGLQTQRNKKSFSNDPCISNMNGPKYAQEAATTIANIVQESQFSDVNVYSSRLMRAIQTASYIARELNVPVKLSTGLAQIISAVKKSEGSFEFADIDEIIARCPRGVQFLSCDAPATTSSTIRKSPTLSRKGLDGIHNNNYADGANHDRTHPTDLLLPTHSWRSVLDTILLNNNNNNVHPPSSTLNIIVAHRETLRKLAGMYLETPYCCMGVFDVELCEEQGEDTGTVINASNSSSSRSLVSTAATTNSTSTTTTATSRAGNNVCDVKYIGATVDNCASTSTTTFNGAYITSKTGTTTTSCISKDGTNASDTHVNGDHHIEPTALAPSLSINRKYRLNLVQVLDSRGRVVRQKSLSIQKGIVGGGKLSSSSSSSSMNSRGSSTGTKGTNKRK
mmetsp:Transcript_20493/g.34834  ORF Transcript_20493/g.34834 Transcript_20493/m.34834 type:complete len:413 (+) Transcript_20493:245-1483(+)